MAEINTGWLVFFSEKEDPLQLKMIRIGASCLGNAVVVAREWANHCNVDLIGVAPDLVSGKAKPSR